ncbi:MAG TPA: glycosyltransferase family 2 protein [Steroidobacteraceae bacterium]|nr:glycosyltransferase family 2 protein [Steroidobacteraceae bacterium]HQZ80273.1 glycosyltransferase family 2 protein [Steroidobacteraceae bacterium]
MKPEVSVVIPVFNEVDNIEPLAREIAAALAGRSFEVIYIDDGSTDATAATVLRLRGAGVAPLRLLQHSRRSGQSAGVCTGVAHAQADRVVTLDGDGQNDPADIPALLAALAAGEAAGVRLVMGNRVSRKDTWRRHMQSRIANGVRGWLLNDGTPDTGCGIKLFDRAVFLSLPQFDHMHRFLPALFQRYGARVVSVPVNHRPRQRGQSKYGMFDRLWVGIVDMFGVMWLARRYWPGLAAREE